MEQHPPPFISNRDALATSPLRRDALAIVEAGIASAHPRSVVPRWVRREDETLLVGADRYPLGPGRVYVIGGGKAAGSMAEALEQVIGPERITAGLVNMLPGPWRTRRIRQHPATHPEPGRGSVHGAEQMLALTADLTPDDLVVCLISGGASAMLEAPAPGVTLRDQQRLTRRLLRSGATIAEINTVRRHLSRTKGGRLAQHLQPAHVVTLLISDHIGGRLEVIGSGPTLPDPTTFADAVAVLHRYGLWERAPRAIRDHLTAGAEGRLPDTPKPGDPCFARSRAYVLADTATAVEGMRQAARARGFSDVLVLGYQIAGEAREAARVLGPVLSHAYRELAPGASRAVLFGGEMTVTIRGRAGRGGRGQEFAAALLPEIAGLRECVVAAMGSDGADYVPGVGGALVDDTIQERAQAAGIDLEAVLADHDTLELHQRLGSLALMVPTGTNVCDLFVCLLRKGRA
ncbi:MAG: DUF4147 domain-containing protein [Chloroflexi bacterium]|nr:DUF4147 domain-containing protein [Chloroflexota bacterium]